MYKLYAESFRGREQLARIQEEAQALVTRILAQRSDIRPSPGG
jgi:phosphoglucomutase